MANDTPVDMMLDTPLPVLIERLGVAISNAQFALDRSTIEIARLLADDSVGVKMPGEDEPRSLLALGFAPTFYHLNEATIEAKVTFSVGRSSSLSVGATAGVNLLFFAASVNASYSQKYSFDASASSTISAKFVSVPPPAPFQTLLRASEAKPGKP